MGSCDGNEVKVLGYKPHRVWQKHKVGNASSKYDFNPEQFEKDVEEHRKKSEKLWNDFVKWMQENEVDPKSIRWMWMRYLEDFE